MFAEGDRGSEDVEPTRRGNGGGAEAVIVSGMERPRTPPALVPAALSCLLSIVACSGGGDEGDVLVERMNDRIAETAARPELDVDRVVVRHILVPFIGAVRADDATRTFVEAEKHAARLLSRIDAGADFAALMAEHSSDPGPGEYEMTRGDREGMATSFWKTSWRLSVGETSVAGYDDTDSPFGWHIIQRVE